MPIKHGLFSINFPATIDSLHSGQLACIDCSFLLFLFSTVIDLKCMSSCKMALIIICKHLQIYTKTVTRLRHDDYMQAWLSEYRLGLRRLIVKY